eukprot:2875833-Heterocapsa_arctica.AAC.1
MTAVQQGGWRSLNTCDNFRSFASHRLWQYSYDTDQSSQHVQSPREVEPLDEPVRHACQYLNAD